MGWCSQPTLTVAIFQHLSGIQTLNMEHCWQTFNPIDAGFVYLRGIQNLNIKWCVGVTDAAFVHLRGIQTLNISDCQQAGITDAIFPNLAGIHSLDMSNCFQQTLTGENLASLGCNLKYLNVKNCNNTLINNATRLYGVTQSDSTVKRHSVECSRTPGKFGFKLPGIGLSQVGGRTRKRKNRKSKKRKTRR